MDPGLRPGAEQLAPDVPLLRPMSVPSQSRNSALFAGDQRHSGKSSLRNLTCSPPNKGPARQRVFAADVPFGSAPIAPQMLSIGVHRVFDPLPLARFEIPKTPNITPILARLAAHVHGHERMKKMSYMGITDALQPMADGEEQLRMMVWRPGRDSNP